MSFSVTLWAPSMLSAVCCSTVTERWKNFPLNDKRRQNATICVTLILSGGDQLRQFILWLKCVGPLTWG